MSRARKPTTPKAEESGHETDLGGGGNSSEEHIQVSGMLELKIRQVEKRYKKEPKNLPVQNMTKYTVLSFFSL